MRIDFSLYNMWSINTEDKWFLTKEPQNIATKEKDRLRRNLDETNMSQIEDSLHHEPKMTKISSILSIIFRSNK